MALFAFLEYMVSEEHQRLEELLDQMSEDELGLPMDSNNTTTMGQRFQHIFEAEHQMAGYMHPHEVPDLTIAEISRASLRKASQQSMQRHVDLLRLLTEGDLEGSWTSKKSGKTYSHRFLLYHFIEHLATHRGQIMAALRVNRGS